MAAGDGGAQRMSSGSASGGGARDERQPGVRGAVADIALTCRQYSVC